VLIRVRGNLAADLLEPELGLWSFEDEGHVDVLELVPMGDAYEIPMAQLNPESPPKSDPYAIPEVRKPEVLRREAADRRWVKIGERWAVEHRAPPCTFSFDEVGNYAAALERVQFAARAEAATKEEE
jgi:hypothetical protein